MTDEAGVPLHEILRGAASYMQPLGLLALEVGVTQAQAIAARALSAGFGGARVVKDYTGRERIRQSVVDRYGRGGRRDGRDGVGQLGQQVPGHRAGIARREHGPASLAAVAGTLFQDPETRISWTSQDKEGIEMYKIFISLRHWLASLAEVDRLTKRRDAITAQLGALRDVVAGFADDPAPVPAQKAAPATKGDTAADEAKVVADDSQK